MEQCQRRVTVQQSPLSRCINVLLQVLEQNRSRRVGGVVDDAVDSLLPSLHRRKEVVRDAAGDMVCVDLKDALRVRWPQLRKLARELYPILELEMRV
eukprot:6486700-Amphidinium_carterae.2